MNLTPAATGVRLRAAASAGGLRETLAQRAAGVLAALYFLNLWHIPGLSTPVPRWFHTLPVAIAIFLLAGAELRAKHSKLFAIALGWMLSGATLSQLRTADPAGAWLNTFGLAEAAAEMLLIIPALASPFCQKMIVWTAIVAATTRSFLVYSVTAQFADAARLMFAGRTDDKNLASLCLATALAIVLGLIVTGFGRSRFSVLQTTFGRYARNGAMLGLGVIFIYCAALTYSRSGLITCMVSVMAALIVYVVRQKRVGRLLPHHSPIVQLVALCTLIVASVAAFYLYAPVFLQRFPYWRTNYEALVNAGETDELLARSELFEKGMMIVKANPIVGIGPGLSKWSDVMPHRSDQLIHNGYVTTWAELGLPGLIAMLYVVAMTLRAINRRTRMVAPDQISTALLLSLVPILFMNLFLDTGTLMVFFLGLVSTLVVTDEIPAAAGRRLRPHMARRPQQPLHTAG